MKLRARLVLVAATVSLPLVLGTILWDARARRRAAEDELSSFTRGLALSPGWRDRCEVDPRSWRGGPPDPHPPPPDLDGDGGLRRSAAPRPFPHREPARFSAYGPDLRAHRTDAPPIPDWAAEKLRHHDVVTMTRFWQAGQVRVLLRMPGPTGACAFVLAEGTTEPWLGAILPATHLWLTPLLAVLASVWLAAGPIVSRVRRLAAATLRSAESAYASGVSDGTGDRDEISELARAFDAAAAQVRAQLAETNRSEAALREFLANTTHDIMVPLAVLQGHLTSLQQQVRQGSALDGQSFGAVMNEAHYLGALIHNLAIAAKLKSGEAHVERAPVDVGALIERVVSRHKPLAKSMGVSIEGATPLPPLSVHADVTLLEQAVGNLVYNAVRHNNPGGHVAVVADPEPGDRFSLSVIDDGPGLPAAQLANAAVRGFRGDQARIRAPDGRGLGLDITRRVAELHGFELVFKRSAYGGLRVDLSGATFAGAPDGNGGPDGT